MAAQDELSRLASGLHRCFKDTREWSRDTDKFLGDVEKFAVQLRRTNKYCQVNYDVLELTDKDRWLLKQMWISDD
jgi:hypothetical protein